MMKPGFKAPFNERQADTAVNVLTIAAAFPSLIQPWLVNHLVQIIKFGGDNRVISRSEQTDVFTDAITDNGLDNKYCCVPTDKWELVKFYFNAMQDKRVSRLQKTLWESYDGQQETFKNKVLHRLISPAFSCDPDIIHSHTEPVGSRLVPLIKATKKPFVMTFHGLPPVGVPLISDDARKQYTGAAEAIFVNTEFAKQQYVSLGAPEQKCIVIPQGIDLTHWPFEPRSFPEDGTVHILTVGRLHPDKGHFYAVEAIKALIEQGMDVRYTMVGSGPEKDTIYNHAESLGISHAIEIFSGIPDAQLRDIYRRAHIFLLPSLRSKDGYHEETQGVVLQEAQATGLLTIATRSGGIPECIDDNNSGYLVEDRNSDALAQTIKSVIDKKDDWHNIQARARQWVEERYSADIIATRMNQYYRDIAGL